MEQRSTSAPRRFAVVLTVVVAVALVVTAVLVALRPFDVSVDLGLGRGDAPSFSGTCDAAAASAWHDDAKDQLALWAVTVGTNTMGYTPVFGDSVKYVLHGNVETAFPGPYCVGEARHRMFVSGALLVAALAIVTLWVDWRRRRSWRSNARPSL